MLTYSNTQLAVVDAKVYAGKLQLRFTYVSNSVQELAQEKIASLLCIRYQNSIADAVADLGKPEEIGQLFAGFQRFLYEPAR